MKKKLGTKDGCIYIYIYNFDILTNFTCFINKLTHYIFILTYFDSLNVTCIYIYIYVYIYILKINLHGQEGVYPGFTKRLFRITLAILFILLVKKTPHRYKKLALKIILFDKPTNKFSLFLR